ncbi:MAG TPA: UDP-N-acetylglucosamine 2-epimerase (non-hydrolyzing) [Acidobacteriota bacterium]|nr:UDP-N-acetylglucosamine 2-epimerase (non-hydrolyzing) [Acidobacteriota bacterium]HRR25271.1 UDP-N-acetylglucosamine 2-epimerase (non-hydrolyzing) [Acidobacteriota bacterium]HRR57060.1 UDP-N-acetylglucosamine 2-epimerase (non-hydrolyzing) [Acidobacteriota bacterium]HRV07362.1 UDP-N-acetylglucosamine 2-epimerase (non-hydrolyzing) [Acidobacteriota bacterium]
MPKTILTLVGTRPEVIKVAPVVHAFRDLEDPNIRHLLCASGQHRDLTGVLFDWFELSPDHLLELMEENQTLAEFSARALRAVDRLLASEKPDLVLCQGDTTTAMVAALASYYRKIPVGHIEAGLRTHDRYEPFPEEVNRSIIDLVSELCFAPTRQAADELRKLGVSEDRVFVTGNTGIDALLWSMNKLDGQQARPAWLPGELHEVASRTQAKSVVLVTAHRRESFGTRLANLAAGISRLAEEYPELTWIWPLHPNPRVLESIRHVVKLRDNFRLIPPLDYPVMCWLLERTLFLITDSGGLQEECPTVGVPVLVTREVTERPEAVEAGNAVLVGTDPQYLIESVRRLLSDPELRASMSTPQPVFGDGKAGRRIAEACRAFLLGTT